MLVLGIETSCDETAAAVVTDSGEVLSDVIQSQIKTHAPYGGIVPELASRDHLQNAQPVLTEAMDRAQLKFENLDGIAVTCRPGLSGALLVGVQVAQGLAWALDKPVVGVDHLMGHLLAASVTYPNTPALNRPKYPFIGLLASGGHTALYRVDGPSVERIQELGATRDDAAGEAFDKVARLLGLGYPGGPIVDSLAREGDPHKIALSQPMHQKSSLEFSFSGLKTNVARWVETNGQPQDDKHLRNLCAAFQDRVVHALVTKAFAAVEQEGLDCLVLGGGVAANSALRAAAQQEGEARRISVVIPPLRACTDNAAMIAYAGTFSLVRGENHLRELRVSPRTILPRKTQKGSGRR